MDMIQLRRPGAEDDEEWRRQYAQQLAANVVFSRPIADLEKASRVVSWVVRIGNWVADYVPWKVLDSEIPRSWPESGSVDHSLQVEVKDSDWGSDGSPTKRYGGRSVGVQVNESQLPAIHKPVIYQGMNMTKNMADQHGTLLEGVTSPPEEEALATAEESSSKLMHVKAMATSDDSTGAQNGAGGGGDEHVLRTVVLLHSKAATPSAAAHSQNPNSGGEAEIYPEHTAEQGHKNKTNDKANIHIKTLGSSGQKIPASPQTLQAIQPFLPVSKIALSLPNHPHHTHPHLYHHHQQQPAHYHHQNHTNQPTLLPPPRTSSLRAPRHLHLKIFPKTPVRSKFDNEVDDNCKLARTQTVKSFASSPAALDTKPLADPFSTDNPSDHSSPFQGGFIPLPIHSKSGHPPGNATYPKALSLSSSIIFEDRKPIDVHLNLTDEQMEHLANAIAVAEGQALDDTPSKRQQPPPPINIQAARDFTRDHRQIQVVRPHPASSIYTQDQLDFATLTPVSPLNLPGRAQSQGQQQQSSPSSFGFRSNQQTRISAQEQQRRQQSGAASNHGPPTSSTRFKAFGDSQLDHDGARPSLVSRPPNYMSAAHLHQTGEGYEVSPLLQFFPHVQEAAPPGQIFSPLTPFFPKTKELIGPSGWLHRTGENTEVEAGSERAAARSGKAGVAGKKKGLLTTLKATAKKMMGPVSTSSSFPLEMLPSLTPREQSLIYCELELAVQTALSTFLDVQFRAGRINLQKLAKVEERWVQKGRPRVPGFSYDVETQLDIVIGHDGLRYHGRRQGQQAEINGLLHTMKTNARAMAVRTFCHPDKAVRKQILDAVELLDLLGSPEPRRASLGLVYQFYEACVERTIARARGSSVSRPGDEDGREKVGA